MIQSVRQTQDRPLQAGVQPLPNRFRKGVRDRLRVRAEAAGLDGLLLLAAGNLIYASGAHFSMNERPIGLYVPVNGEPQLYVPLLERENALDVPDMQVFTYAEFPGVVPPVLWMIEHSGARRLGIDTLEARLVRAVEEKLDTLDLTDYCLRERSVKQPEERALVRAAAGFADVCLERLLAQAGIIIAAGGTEQDLMDDCVSFARNALFDAHAAAFSGTKSGITASVHSGPRAALPHGSVVARRPQAGETLVAGIGCSLGGYHAESGVTLIVGEINAEQRRIMQLMNDVNAATVTALAQACHTDTSNAHTGSASAQSDIVVPGKELSDGLRFSCSAVDSAALDVLRQAGLGDTLRHRIGHGMGVEGHEAPWLAPGDDTRIVPGMVFSCEPGVYRPGHDGYRCIESLIVGEHSVETVSRFQTEHPIDTRVIAICS